MKPGEPVVTVFNFMWLPLRDNGGVLESVLVAAQAVYGDGPRIRGVVGVPAEDQLREDLAVDDPFDLIR